MKKSVLYAILTAVMVFALAGCGGEKEAEPLTMDDFALLDKSGDVVLEYRMTRETAEQYIGLPNGTTNDRVEYGATYIWYDDGGYKLRDQFPDRAYNLSTIETIVTTDTKYKTPRGISIGSSYDSVLKAYGMPVGWDGETMTQDELDHWKPEWQITYLYELDSTSGRMDITFDFEDDKVSMIFVG